MREGAEAFHAALDGIHEEVPATEKIRLALRAHLRVVAEQLDIATVFVREWRHLEGERRDEIVASAAATRSGFASSSGRGASSSELRTDLDARPPRCSPVGRELGLHVAAPGRDTDDLADRFYALLVDGMRGYATPA